MKKIFLIILFVAVFIIPFWFSNIDIDIQKIFYDNSNDWKYKDNFFVLFFYNYAIYPALFVGIISVIILSIGNFYGFLLKFRKPAIIFLLALILGPGLLVNVIGKNFSGRPRPREISEFKGDWKYRKVFELGVPGKGHSFPCGHCSMGFIFYSFFVVLRNKRKLQAYITLLFSLLFGFAIGISRMAQGAHFLSDVIWAGIFTFVSAEVSLLVSGYIEEYFTKTVFTKNRIIEFTVMFVLVIVLIFIFLLATPFYREKKYEFSEYKNNLLFSINIDEGDIKFKKNNDKIKLLINASGFAAPKRKYEESIDLKNEGDKSNIIFKIIKKGLFSELNSIINFEIPAIYHQITANVKKGSITYEAEGNLENCVFYTGKGDIIFSPINNSELKDIYLKARKGNIIIFFNKNIKIKGPADFFIHAKNGNVIINNQSVFLSDLLKEKERIKGAKEIIYKSGEANGLNINIISEGVYIK
ncbi:MAG: phosphatase PAP2 family protein [Candidatus Goldbacteria bacterium]|nr:phosphatase PAP2 family protein [Candidatus Goldiibacteriota bacterium]